MQNNTKKVTVEKNARIRRCTEKDVAAMYAIINEAAQVYCGVIPEDCWHEPYMPREVLEAEIAAGVNFWGWETASGELAGVMGLQQRKDAMIIRHAYVRSGFQGQGVGAALLAKLIEQSPGLLLVGTWAASDWAIRFYQRHGFRLASREEGDKLLTTYWSISPRQRKTSVAFVYER